MGNSAAHVDVDARAIFANTGLQVTGCAFHLLGVSLLAHCFSRRVNFESISALLRITLGTFCLLIALLLSWIFVLISGVLIFGVGLESSSSICSGAIDLTIAVQEPSKIFVFLFFVERLHSVWSPHPSTRRRMSPLYIVSSINLAIYTVLVILMIMGRVHYIRSDGVCIVGLKRYSSIPVACFEFCFHIFLTLLFLAPLRRSPSISPVIRRLAIRSAIATTACLAASIANKTVVGLVVEQEKGWAWLTAYGLVVVCNGLVLFWATDAAATDKPAPKTNNDVRIPQRNSARIGPLLFTTPNSDTPAPQTPEPDQDIEYDSISARPLKGQASFESKHDPENDFELDPQSKHVVQLNRPDNG